MKTCLVCMQPQPEAAETCSECGEGSWSPSITPVAPPPATRDTKPSAAPDESDESRARRVGKSR